MMLEDFTKYVMSANRALLGSITGNVGAVLIGWEDDVIYLKFITFAHPTENDRECSSVVATEILADFPEMDIVEEIVEVTGVLADMANGRHSHCVFLRSEMQEP